MCTHSTLCFRNLLESIWQGSILQMFELALEVSLRNQCLLGGPPFMAIICLCCVNLWPDLYINCHSPALFAGNFVKTWWLCCLLCRLLCLHGQRGILHLVVEHTMVLTGKTLVTRCSCLPANREH